MGGFQYIYFETKACWAQKPNNIYYTGDTFYQKIHRTHALNILGQNNMHSTFLQQLTTRVVARVATPQKYYEDIFFFN